MTFQTFWRMGCVSLMALSFTGCMAAKNYSAEEQEIVDNLAASNYQPATREMRQNIETQELLAQGAFWSREYQLNPADLEAAVKLAATVRKMGNPARAVEITQTTRALYPKDPYLTAEYAAALIASERGQEALKPLDTALGTTPNYARLWSLKGAALDQLEQYDMARQHYQRALRLSPNDPNVMANLGLSYALSGDPRSAENWLRKAAALPGAGPNIHQNLNLVMQLQGKAAPAPQTPRQISASTPRQPIPQGYRQPARQTASASPHLRGAPTPPRRAPSPGTMTAPASQGGEFQYSANVYTNTSDQGGPRTASEAAMAAAQKSQTQRVQPQSLPPQPQRGYPAQSYGYPGAQSQYPQQPTPQPRGAARRR